MENLLNRIYLITFTGETNRSGWIALPTFYILLKAENLSSITFANNCHPIY